VVGFEAVFLVDGTPPPAGRLPEMRGCFGPSVHVKVRKFERGRRL
jgi:hypothetical protein